MRSPRPVPAASFRTAPIAKKPKCLILRGWNGGCCLVVAGMAKLVTL